MTFWYEGWEFICMSATASWLYWSWRPEKKTSAGKGGRK